MDARRRTGVKPIVGLSAIPRVVAGAADHPYPGVPTSETGSQTSSSRGTSSSVREAPSRTTSSAQRAPMRSSVISRWRSSTPRTGRPSTPTIRSSARRPARSAGRALDHLDDLDRAIAAERGRHARRQRPRSAGDPDPGAAHAAVAHQGRDDPAGRRVDRHREAEADARHRGVDPDHAAAAVDQRAARVAGVQRRVGLDHVVDDPRRAAGASGQRAAERRHHAGRDRARVAVRVADRDHELADAQRRRRRRARPARRPAPSARRTARSDSGSEPTMRRLDVAAVDERGAHARAGAGDDVRAGEHEAVRRDHDAGSAAGRAAATAPRPEVGHRRPERLRHAGHHARVGVERLGVVRSCAGG